MEPCVIPNLFIVGAPKCGTTAWVEYLSSHPDVFFPSVKEPNHFTTDGLAGWRITSRDEYLRLFAGSGGARVVGEASVTHLYSEVAAENIQRFNPDAKIIILLREQEYYLPSRHNQLLYNGLESIADFATAWRLSGKRDAANMPRFCKNPRTLDYRTAGAFSAQAERYFARFPEDQIRVFHFRDWTRNPRGTYLEMMRFLGIGDDGRTEFPTVNQARHHRSQLLGRLVHRPPQLVGRAASLIKKLTGRSRIGIGEWLMKLESRS
ncbi:MAG TPA: sulfotransferase domain-containing protein, partial [Verrucomicrobiae bacterium]|nr:sulfotransferase domain-containing protein [Verrucomicrobiae bacterium]